MPIATLHIAEVGGYAGRTVCWRLDPPVRIDGRDYEYVSQSITERYDRVPARIRVYPATETAAGALPVLAEVVGSFALRDDYLPGDQAYEDGIRAWSLGMLGGYEIQAEQ